MPANGPVATMPLPGGPGAAVPAAGFPLFGAGPLAAEEDLGDTSDEEDLAELEWQRQLIRQIPPCPQAAPGERQLQAVNANDPFECTQLVSWACEALELPVGELFQNMLSDTLREPGCLPQLIKEAWQALILFLPDKRQGVSTPWAPYLGHAMEILRKWAANAEAAMARTTSFLEGQGMELRCYCQKCLTFFWKVAQCPGCNGMKRLGGKPAHHLSKFHPSFGCAMAGLKRSNNSTLWVHGLTLIAHGAHPDDAAQKATHHQIEHEALRETQAAIEEDIAARARKAEQAALELALQDKVRATNKKLVAEAIDNGLEPKRARTLGGGVAMSPSKKGGFAT